VRLQQHRPNRLAVEEDGPREQQVTIEEAVDELRTLGWRSCRTARRRVAAAVRGEAVTVGRVDKRRDDVPLGAQRRQQLRRRVPVVEGYRRRAVIADDLRERREVAGDGVTEGDQVVGQIGGAGGEQRYAAGEHRDEAELSLDREVAERLHRMLVPTC